MTKIVDELRNLVELQEIDIEIDNLNLRIKEIPEQIARITQNIEQKKKQLEEEKNLTQKLQIELKNKNLELETTEQTIRKHLTELNLVKTNQAYRALQDEIDACKKQKNNLEDEILSLLEKIDIETKKYKDSVELLKKEELKTQETIKTLNEEIQKLSNTLNEKKSLRTDLTSKISQIFIAKYDYLRTKKNSKAVVPLEGSGCGGCYMKLSPQNLNELYRLYHEDPNITTLVLCENCSRILYLPNGLPEL